MAAPLVVVENFRALFYAPFYLAHTTGAYADEGVSVVLQSSASPAESAHRLAEGSADVMWGGPLRVLIDHDRNPASELQCFCPVVCRDPFFVIGRTPKPDFTFADLTTVRLGTVSEVPTPWICLAHDVRTAGIDPASLDRREDARMADNAAALRRGELDAVQLFQPYAEHLIADGTGHVWYAAANRGPTAYTTLVARKPVLESQRFELAAMKSAMEKTLRRIAATSGAALAPLLAVQFPALAPEILAACIDRYKALGLWSADPALLRNGFDWLRAAMLAAGKIRQDVSFGACVDTGFM